MHPIEKQLVEDKEILPYILQSIIHLILFGLVLNMVYCLLVKRNVVFVKDIRMVKKANLNSNKKLLTMLLLLPLIIC